MVGLELMCAVSDCTEHLVCHMQSTDTFLDKCKAALKDYNDTDFTECVCVCVRVWCGVVLCGMM